LQRASNALYDANSQAEEAEEEEEVAEEEEEVAEEEEEEEDCQVHLISTSLSNPLNKPRM